MRPKTWLKYAFGLVLTGLLLAWVLREAEPAAVWDSLRRASWLALAAGALLNFAHTVPRVWRWGALLEPVRKGIAFRSMFSAVILGYTTSWVVPGRLGELVRPALLSARERLPLGPCLGSVVVDRLLDGLCVLALFALGLAATPLAGDSLRHVEAIRQWSLLLVCAIALPIAALSIIAAQRARLERWLSGGGRIRARIGGAVLAVSGGVLALRRPRLLARVVLHTFCAWILIALGTWLGVRAAGAEIPFRGILVILPLLVLGIALPTPGGAGGYHAGMVFGLTRLFPVDEAAAVGAAFLVHAGVILPVIAAGVVLLFVERIPFGDLLRVGRQAAPHVERVL